LRETCTDCALKHLSQASILLHESRHGYPLHIHYSRGHMAEAEAELAKLYPKHSDMVRAERKKLEDRDDYTPDFNKMIEKIDKECLICDLAGNPRPNSSELPSRGTGRSTGRSRKPAGPSRRLSESERQKRHARCEAKVARCVSGLRGRRDVNPYAVCRAKVKC